MTWRFEDPEALGLLALVAGTLAWRLWPRRGAARRFPGIGSTQLCGSWRVRARWVPMLVSTAALVLLVVAIARPREPVGHSFTPRQGIAIELVVDRSFSMSAPMDVGGRQINRLELVKRVLHDFVLGDKDSFKGRPDDLVGLVVFSGLAETVCPLVRSHDILVDLLNQTQLGPTSLPEGGTNIGDALALAAARLKNAEATETLDADGSPVDIKSKIVILLTDGENNVGDASPVEAAQLAAEWGIRVYTIGVGGTGGFVRVPDETGRPRSLRDTIDEPTLRRIAEITGGRYFNARDAGSLRDVYSEIDTLERTEIRTIEYAEHIELFTPLAAAAGVLLVLESLLGSVVLRRIS